MAQVTKSSGLSLEEVMDLASGDFNRWIESLTDAQLQEQIENARGFDVIGMLDRMGYERVVRLLISIEHAIHDRLPEERRELLAGPMGRRFVRLAMPNFCRS